MLTAIPTAYRGVKFRSRQEARWALLFDQMGIRWQYEVEGYQLRTCWYLPDFWLPAFDCFAEVKGVSEQWDEVAKTKAIELAIASCRPVLMLSELRPLNQHVLCAVPSNPSAGPAAFGAQPAAGVDALLVDLPESVRRDRLWFESDLNEEALFEFKVRDDEWAYACEAARIYRFGVRGRHVATQ